MRILYALLALMMPLLFAANAPSQEEVEVSPAAQRTQLFHQIKEKLDEAYTLAISASDELSDENRQALNQSAEPHLESVWQDVSVYNAISENHNLMRFPFSQMELKIDTLEEAQKTKNMFILLMTSLAVYQTDFV